VQISGLPGQTGMRPRGTPVQWEQWQSGQCPRRRSQRRRLSRPTTAPTTAEGIALTFANNSTIAAGNLGYLWSFGDGNSSNAQNPTHTYADTGNFSVGLISYTQNCSDTLIKSVAVNPVPQANFSVNRVCVID